MVMTIYARRRHNTANGVRVMNEILAERFTGPKVDLFRQVPYLGPPEESNSQRAPILPLHTGHAPHPCRARVTSAIAICSSLVARSALGAYRRPPCRSQVF